MIRSRSDVMTPSGGWLGSSRQPLPVPAQMILDEGGDEIIAVVVALLHPQRQRDPGLPAGRVEQLGSQLAFEEAVASSLINEDLRNAGVILDERDGIRLAPRRAVWSEIAAERLLAPRDLRRGDD